MAMLAIRGSTSIPTGMVEPADQPSVVRTVADVGNDSALMFYLELVKTEASSCRKIGL